MGNRDKERGRLAESLAYWYLRLNGFLTVESFILHPDSTESKTGKRTDADIVGIRFPDRDEQGMRDDPRFANQTKPLLVISEAAAAGKCKMNGPWSRPEKGNMQRLLTSLGLPGPDDVEATSLTLYKECFAETDRFCFQYVCFGMETNPGLQEARNRLVQITWPEVLVFIHNRFQKHRRVKVDHQGWRQDGLDLWDASSRSEKNFVNGFVKKLQGAPTEQSEAESLHELAERMIAQSERLRAEADRLTLEAEELDGAVDHESVAEQGNVLLRASTSDEETSG